MQATHKVPTHMSLPDKVVFGLTARQLLLLLIGCSLGHNLWLHLSVVAAFILRGQVLRIGITLLPVVVAVVLAFIAVAGRPLEVWLLVLVRYWQRPQLYLWRSLRGWEQQQKDEHDRAPMATAVNWNGA
jgi:PrgI family protein